MKHHLLPTVLSFGFKNYVNMNYQKRAALFIKNERGNERRRKQPSSILSAKYLHHEIVTEAPAWLSPLLPQGSHVILKLA